MTIQKTENTISHLGDGVTITFPYDFRVDREEYMFVTINGFDYEGPILVEGVGDPVGGEVTFLDDFIPAENDLIVLYRRLDLKQVIDYRDYDAFPAETHELGLDNLTMMLQQHDERIQSSVQMPVGDTANQVLPAVAERAEKFLYFDVEGNATAFQADIDQPYLTSLEIDDGSFGGYPSRQMLRIDTQSEGVTKPKLSVITPNTANALLQLDEQGKIPLGLNRIIGLKVRGPYRGDDLCPKPGDDPSDCTDPDYRNPTERFPELAETFAGGDCFIVSFAGGETEGFINAYPNLGADTMEPVQVTPRDVIIFLPEARAPSDPDTILTYEGWYVIKNFVEVGDALFVAYNDTGNEYVLGSTVQAALDSTDNHLQERDTWLTTKQEAERGAYERANPNTIIETGFYAVSGSSAMPSTGDYTIIATRLSAALVSQLAQDTATGALYVRTYNGTWRAWSLIATAAEYVKKAGDIMTGNLNINNGTGDSSVILKARTGGFPSVLFQDTDFNGRAKMFYNESNGSMALVTEDAGGNTLNSLTLLADGTQRGSSTAPVNVNDITNKAYVDGQVASRKSNQDFLRTGTRLDIYNVRTS